MLWERWAFTLPQTNAQRSRAALDSQAAETEERPTRLTCRGNHRASGGWPGSVSLYFIPGFVVQFAMGLAFVMAIHRGQVVDNHQCRIYAIIIDFLLPLQPVSIRLRIIRKLEGLDEA